jgi:hypothetical protein
VIISRVKLVDNLEIYDDFEILHTEVWDNTLYLWILNFAENTEKIPLQIKLTTEKNLNHCDWDLIDVQKINNLSWKIWTNIS